MIHVSVSSICRKVISMEICLLLFILFLSASFSADFLFVSFAVRIMRAAFIAGRREYMRERAKRLRRATRRNSVIP